jgi:hypothetical protein
MGGWLFEFAWAFCAFHSNRTLLRANILSQEHFLIVLPIMQRWAPQNFGHHAHYYGTAEHSLDCGSLTNGVWTQTLKLSWKFRLCHLDSVGRVGCFLRIGAFIHFCSINADSNGSLLCN